MLDTLERNRASIPGTTIPEAKQRVMERLARDGDREIQTGVDP